MKQAVQKGFTLIELAIVIAIIAILAAVALPQFQGAEEGAEEGVIRDMVSRLNSAAAIFTAANAQTPTNFDDFVIDNGQPGTGNPGAGGQASTISLGNFGTNGGCTTGGATIDCGAAFGQWTNTSYQWRNGAVCVTATATGNRPDIDTCN